jgi:hypothetical protein
MGWQQCYGCSNACAHLLPVGRHIAKGLGRELLTHCLHAVKHGVSLFLLFAVVFGGGKAVQWATPDPSSFPPYKGVVPIILSWFFSRVHSPHACRIPLF